LNSPTIFRAFDASQYDSLRWDFGDDQTIQKTSADSIIRHIFSRIGTYTATLKTYHCNAETVYEIPISISTPTPINFQVLDSLCVNTKAFKLAIAKPDSGWYFINSLISDSLHPTIVGSGNKYITYKIMNDSGCWSIDSTQITINALPAPVISLSRSPFLCEDDSVILQSNYDNNEWSNGLTTKTIILKESAKISLMVLDSFGCKNTSTSISIVSKKPPTTKILALNNIVCEGSSFTLAASGEGDFYWNNGYHGNHQNLIALTTQTHKVTVSNYCGSAEDSVLIKVLRSSAKAYPNPAQNYLSVDLSECEGTGQSIEIIDELGRTIFFLNTDQLSEVIDLYSLTEGLYFCRVGREHFSLFKIVVLK
jgi:PKD repeat protein